MAPSGPNGGALAPEPGLASSAREDPPTKRRHGRWWHAANVVSALVIVAIVIASLQLHPQASGIAVSVLRNGPQARVSGMFVQVRHASNMEVIAGQRLPVSGRLTFRLPAGRYFVEARRAPGSRVNARLLVYVSDGSLVSAALRLPKRRNGAL